MKAKATLLRLLSALAVVGTLAVNARAQDPLDTALAKVVDFDIDKVPLQDALKSISKKSQIPIVSDRRAFESELIDDQQLLITQHTSGKSLETILDGILAPHGLTWIKRHDVLLITTPKAAGEHYSIVRLYKVIRKVPVARRVHSIQTSVAPQSWKVNGGNGDISPLPRDFIVIRQSPLIHREIATAFAQSIAPVQGDWYSKFGDDALDKVLSGAASVTAIEAPLSSILKQLAKKHSVELSIDEAAMTESGIDLQSLKVALQADNIPRVASALSLLLELAHPDLIWVVDGKKLTITTKSSAAKSLSTRKQDLSDIIAKVDGKYLVEAIEYNLSPATWQFGGGDGTIELTDDAKLLVQQIEPVHREVEQLLSDLRHSLREAKSK